MITGPCCDIGWYLEFGGQAEAELTLYLDQMVPEGGLILATPYPAGASFTIQRCLPSCQDVTRGNSLEDVLEAPGTVYFVDSRGRLFMKLVDEFNGYFEAGGVQQLVNGNRWY